MTQDYKQKDTTKGTSHDIRLHLSMRYFHSQRLVFQVIGLTCLLVVQNSRFCIVLYARPQSRSGSSRGGDEARERVLRVGRDVGWVVGVDLDGPEVGFLEVDEEARYEDCCEAVIVI